MKVQPGDVVFAHSNGLMAKAIRWGERLRFRRTSWANHMALVWKVENGKAYVIQAEPRGVTNDKTLDTLGEVVVFRPTTVVAEDAIFFGQAQVGKRYGWWSIVSVTFDIITWDWVPSIRKRGTWICSALVLEMLRFGGLFFTCTNWGDIYLPTPAQGLEVAHLLNWERIV